MCHFREIMSAVDLIIEETSELGFGLRELSTCDFAWSLVYIKHLAMHFLMLLERPDKNDLSVVWSRDFIKYSVSFRAESL